jgi:hypothetical protein
MRAGSHKRQPLLGNGVVHVAVAMNQHTIIGEPLDAVVSIYSEGK